MSAPATEQSTHLLMPVYSLGRAGGGGVRLALEERPSQAVTPTLAES
ncbi:MAG: hypothetical protein ABI873_04560 [Marmoricola sp.]